MSKEGQLLQLHQQLDEAKQEDRHILATLDEAKAGQRAAGTTAARLMTELCKAQSRLGTNEEVLELQQRAQVCI